MQGSGLTAVYAIGPERSADEPAAWTPARRAGLSMTTSSSRKTAGARCAFTRAPDGGLKATWVSPDGKNSMAAGMRWIDPQISRRRSPIAAAGLSPSTGRRCRSRRR